MRKQHPDGLFGDELNLSERILCVADIVSALYTKRSYKEAYDTETVVTIVTAMAERGEIDAAVVRVFISRLPEILASVDLENESITARYKNAEREYLQRKAPFVG